ncbi:fatty-acyl coenzyme A oxidase [Balamuthia mandrillaris]
MSTQPTPPPRNKEMESLARERQSSPFAVRQMTHLINGGEQNTRLIEKAALLIERDPQLVLKDFFDHSRPEARRLCMAQILRSVQVRKALKDPHLIAAFNHVMNSYDRGYSMRLYVHDTLFRESIFTHGTPQQWQQWKEPIESMQVIGCFAMTELGHSSFLRGVETTATYDRAAREFVINSPTITAAKWWIGMAGETATHTVALCRLLVDGEDKGLQWFIVPLRSRTTGHLLPGVACGDIGAKMGRNGLDNGWILFTQVRVPLENMLMKWAQLTPDGKFSSPPNPQLAYNTLIGERIFALLAMSDQIRQAVTIAVRYGAVRRQGSKDQAILDYQSHQYQLVPIVATGYALHFVSRSLLAAWNDQLEHQNEPARREGFLKSLSDYHGISAGLKAALGWWTADGLETVRRTMGGHGYSAYNAIAGQIADFGVITTGGGDNIVLAQQCARYLLSSLKRAYQGKELTGSVLYFTQLETILQKQKLTSSNSALSIEDLLQALQWLTLKHLSTVALIFQQALSNQHADKEQVWNDHMMELVSCARLHSWYFVAQQFADTILQLRQQNNNNQLVEPLEQLLRVVLLSRVNAEMNLFLEYEYLNAAQSKLVRQQLLERCRQVRTYVVGLVDAFNYPDWILKSPMGCYDGNIYEKYFETLRKAPNGGGERPAYWEEFIAPLTNPSPAQRASL